MSSTADDLQRGWHLPADGVALELSGHALRRWSERISGLPAADVMSEVVKLLESATVSRTPPPWAEDLRQHTKPDAWLVLDGMAAAPLHQTGEGPAEVWLATTVVTPATSAIVAAEMIGTGLRIGTIGPRTEDDRVAVSAREARRETLRKRAST